MQVDRRIPTSGSVGWKVKVVRTATTRATGTTVAQFLEEPRTGSSTSSVASCSVELRQSLSPKSTLPSVLQKLKRAAQARKVTRIAGQFAERQSRALPLEFAFVASVASEVASKRKPHPALFIVPGPASLQ